MVKPNPPSGAHCSKTSADAAAPGRKESTRKKRQAALDEDEDEDESPAPTANPPEKSKMQDGKKNDKKSTVSLLPSSRRDQPESWTVGLSPSSQQESPCRTGSNRC